MKAIEDGVGELQRLVYNAFKPPVNVISDASLRRVLRQVIQEAFKEVINADNRKP